MSFNLNGDFLEILIGLSIVSCEQGNSKCIELDYISLFY